MTVYALDVSAAQPKTDVAGWRKVKAGGISAIWAKATDGVGSPDGNFMSHAQGGLAAGLLVGAYHYARVRAGGPQAQDGIAQADEFCDRYLQAKCNLPPMVDVESNGQPSVDAESWMMLILQIVGRIRERLGKWCIIYTSKGEWESFGLQSFLQVKELPLWLANTSGTMTPSVPKPWTVPMLFQYSWQAHVEGISVNVDVSVFNGSASKLKAWAGKLPIMAAAFVATGLGLLYAMWKGGKRR